MTIGLKPCQSKLNLGPRLFRPVRTFVFIRSVALDRVVLAVVGVPLYSSPTATAEKRFREPGFFDVSSYAGGGYASF